jgi:SAM-dependent methyltransferase
MKKSKNNIREYLNNNYTKCVDSIFLSGNFGYWSNLSKAQNDEFTKILEIKGCKTAVKSFMPQFEDMIFSAKREAALELLDHDKEGVCIDYGAMWGVLSVGMAKRGHQVISVDQTYDSLNFLKSRSIEEKLNNIHLVQDDLRKVKFRDIADYAIVNGVLEWIPETSDVVVNEYYDGPNNKKKISETNEVSQKPRDMQLAFLRSVYESLKPGGQLLLTIENKFSYEYFLGKPDPHVNLLFTTFLPRGISNLISRVFRKKDYRTHIYSFSELVKLIKEAGFSKIEDFCCFPMYHFPALIVPNSLSGIAEYESYEDKNRITWKGKIANKIEIFLMKFFKARNLCPAIVIVAKK